MAKLLFFDTFTQEQDQHSGTPGWAVINFPTFVVVEEIIIIPNGARLTDRLPLEGG